uniref:SFRICE_034252 n=1 Tax=Spodoptera frugiperda TaxID=7108 RepID=A0A2H1VJG5_SPOFR
MEYSVVIGIGENRSPDVKLVKMDCAFCNRTMEGCASIKCSLCASQYHLECVSSEHLVPSTNTWRCCRCESLNSAATQPKIDTAVRV